MAEPDPSSWLGWIAAAGIGAERLWKLWKERGERDDVRHRQSVDDAAALFNRALSLVEHYEKESEQLRQRHREEVAEIRQEFGLQISELQARLDILEDERDSYRNLLEARGWKEWER